MSDLQDAAFQAAETLQTAHIKHEPSVKHDLAPSTAADRKERVELDTSPDEDDASAVEEDEIPTSILRPAPRRPQMPPLPDLRFEQSYLASIKDASNWQMVSYITIRDQVILVYGLNEESKCSSVSRFSCRWFKVWPGRLLWPAGDTGMALRSSVGKPLEPGFEDGGGE